MVQELREERLRGGLVGGVARRDRVLLEREGIHPTGVEIEQAALQHLIGRP
jgi:hypothetical protein